MQTDYSINIYITEKQLKDVLQTLDINNRIYEISKDIEESKDLDLLEELIDTSFYINIPDLEKNENFLYGDVELKKLVVKYTDSSWNVCTDFKYFGGAKNLINKAKQAKKDNYNHFIELKDELKKRMVYENKSIDSSLENKYDFLIKYFELSVSKEEFADKELRSEIVIKQKNLELSKKDMTISMIGVLFNFICSDLDYFKSRLCFKYTRKKYTNEIYYKEAIKQYKRDTAKNKELPYKRFEDNLNRAFRLFCEHRN
ncbi:MAG: hypothetical protein ACE364_01105 [Chlorobiota bacterium]